MADITDMDEFAQTRGADDLFDDEIIPVSAEQQAQTEVVVQEAEPVPPEEPVVERAPVEKPPAREDASQRSRGTERGRGRGRGRGGRGRGGRGGRVENATQHKASTTAGEPKSERASVAVSEGEGAREETATPEKPQKGLKEQPSQSEEATADATANGAEAQRVPAVRGDRSATGGVRKVWRSLPLVSMVTTNSMASQNSPRKNCQSALQLPRKTQSKRQPLMLALKQMRHRSWNGSRSQPRSDVRNKQIVESWTTSVNKIASAS